AKAHLYVEAARALGCRDGGILVRYLLPNVVAPLIVTATLGLGTAILSAAALSFLGLGSQPPEPEWGRMLSEGPDYLREAWWIATFPGLGIMATVLGMNLVGDGLRDVLDPRLREGVVAEQAAEAAEAAPGPRPPPPRRSDRMGFQD